MEFSDIQHYMILILATVSFLITISNLRFLESLNSSFNTYYGKPLKFSVSILVPARNEELRIKQCLEALMAQTDNSIEIIVLDDRSTDDTSNIIQKIIKADIRAKMISGSNLPDGWVGKNWACHQLAKAAKGDYLLFIDADTILSEGTVSVAVMESLARKIDLLTVMPKRIASCIAEQLMFPFIDWASFCWIPMKAAHKSHNPHLSATFGQFMLFKREAYDSIGGHESIRGNPFDDFELGRMTKRQGLKWMLFEGASYVKVLPYKGNIDAFKGISRSIFPAVDYRVSVLALLSVVVLTLGFLPPLTVAINYIGSDQRTIILIIALASIILIIIPWYIICRKFNHSLITIPFYPFSIALMVIIGIHSLTTYGFGVTLWKGRRLGKRRIIL